MTMFRLTRGIRLRTGRAVYCKQFIRHGSAVLMVQHPMQLLLGLGDASQELLNSLRPRFAPDCPTNSWEGVKFILLDNLPIKHAERYPKIIRNIVDRQVAFHLDYATPFEQFEKYEDGKHFPPGVALKARPTTQVSKIRSELLGALQGLPGIEGIKSRELLYCPFSRPQTAAAARQTAEALKTAFPKGILLGMVNRLVLLEGAQNKFEPAYRGDFYFKGAKKDVKYE
jgi:hypothetical protein